MDKQPVFFCVCSQKGGVGKSTFTILLASWLHYALGRDVLVVDCDAPQWSIVAQRERELDVLERNDRYKLIDIDHEDKVILPADAAAGLVPFGK